MSFWDWLLRRRRREEELDEEVQAHLRMAAQERMEQGESPEQARTSSLREFGNVTLVKEVTRDMWSFRWHETLLQDLRYGLRMLRKSPGFTAVAVLTLALGIGANTAVFSVAYAVLLKPLPYNDPARLLRIYSASVRSGGDHWMNSRRDIAFMRRQSSDFQGIAYFQEGDGVLTGIGEPERILTVTVSEDFFSTLGVPPVEGRTFLPEEHTQGRDQVLVLSDALCRRHFGSRAAIGQTITLDGRVFTVVGVMPAGFHFPGTEPPVKTDIWQPWSSPVDPANGNRDVAAIARLKPGVTLRQAEAELAAIHFSLVRAYPNNADWGLRLVPLQADVASAVRLPILIIFGAVSFVLLIACANVANLMLARGVPRQREMAVRTALGAGRLRLIRQLVTESALLSLTGGGVGLAIAVWGIRALRSTEPTDIPRLAEVQLSGPVLLFTLASSLFVGLLFGLVPALPTSNLALRDGPRNALVSTGAGTRRRSLNRFLLITQMALSLVLLIGAGLMVRSFLLLTSVNLGFQPDNVLTFGTGLSGANYASPDRRASFYQQTLGRINAVPGVESVALASSLALTGPIGVSVQIEGRPIPQRGDEAQVAYQAITPDYFRVMRIPLVEGRFISSRDGKDAPAVVVVNQAFVRKFFPGVDPLGQRLRIEMGGGKNREVVGVVGDVREEGLAIGPSPEAYVPLFQAWVSPGMAYVVRTRVEPLSLAQTIRREILDVDKNQPIAQIQTMEQILYGASAPPRFRTELLSLFSLLALVLTAVGLFGVTAYLVSQRTHEIGVRIALGAPPARILMLVLRESAVLIGAGILLGLAGAIGLTRIVSTLLFEIKPTDPATFLFVSSLMLAVGFLACYIPARRATKVDPMVALRYE
jgi:putative ABC transport system permease protein